MTEHPPETTGAAPARTGPTRGAHRAPRTQGARLVLLAALLLVSVVAAGVMFVVRSEDAPGARPDVATDVADWVDAELPADASLGAPEDLRTDLAAAGLPADRLVGADAGDLQVVEGDPGADAVAVARFPAPDGTLLTVVDPSPVEPTADELDRRQRLSAAVLANPVAGATGRAAAVLRAAEVDARLLGLLAVLVARLDAGVADMPRAPGQPEEGTPARRMLLATAGGEDLAPGSAATERVRDFLAAQEPPFAPDTVEETEDGLLVGFDYSPSPDADVTAATQ